jgi:biotin carboxylase
MSRPLVVVVGLNRPLLAAIDRSGRYDAVLVEEPEVSAAKNAPAAIGDFAAVRTLLTVPYQQSEELLHDPRVLALRPVAVVPGQEYAVEAAAALAQLRGLPGAGVAAAGVLRDKIRLRETTAAAGMRAPAWQEVHEAADVARFVARRGAAVLKPANRQASVGVRVLQPGDDPAEAWRRCRSAGERGQLADRPMRWRYLVEQRLTGAEFSVESLVSAGTVRFANVTSKRLLPGRHPVELGHDVPAPADRSVTAELLVQVARLVDAVGFADGILHSEWKVDETSGRAQATLVECAGRTPGDSIVSLIALAYGFDPYLALVDLLAGTDPRPPTRAGRGAAIRFLPASPGRFLAVAGVPAALAMPHVVDVTVLARTGADFTGVTSSWDRVAQVIAVAPDAAAAATAATRAVTRLQVVVDDSAGTGAVHREVTKRDPVAG